MGSSRPGRAEAVIRACSQVRFASRTTTRQGLPRDEAEIVHDEQQGEYELQPNPRDCVG